jgi:hypothetical protein
MTPALRSYVIKTLILHLLIFIIYTGITSYQFVAAKYPDPIGTGIRQLFCILLHLIITLVIVAPHARTVDKKLGWKKFSIHLLSIILIVILSFLLSTPIWKWLWNMRPLHKL